MKKTGNRYYLDEHETAAKHCIWCGEECEKTELLHTGESVEQWCYCPKCNSESWHPIKKIEPCSSGHTWDKTTGIKETGRPHIGIKSKWVRTCQNCGKREVFSSGIFNGWFSE